jgi:hypothetical protein
MVSGMALSLATLRVWRRVKGLVLALAAARRRGGTRASEAARERERERVRTPGAQGCEADTIPGYLINLQSVTLIQSDSTT